MARLSERQFAWLWGAFAVSTAGTWLAFDAFPLIAILALDAGPAAVSALAACGLAAGALVGVPLGPWVERRRKRPVMIGADLVRFAVLLTVPVAYALGRLTIVQLAVVAVVVAAADIAFRAASGAYLKAGLSGERLLVANGRFEATMWTAAAFGPPAGGALIALVGPVVTVTANAASFVLSALGLRAIGGDEPAPAAAAQPLRRSDALEGWRAILASPALRPLFLNVLLVNALIMVSAPLMAVLMLGELGFSAWEYALAFGAPCIAGLLGARLARRLVARRGRTWVLRVVGTLRALPPVGLAFVVAGAGGLVLVIALQLVLVTCAAAFNSVLATVRLELAPADRVARVIAAWTVSTSLAVATLTALWGLLAAATSPRFGVAAAGVLLLATPLLLQRVSDSPTPSTRTGTPRFPASSANASAAPGTGS